jgi:pyridoxal phosphate enzyme (YggS family)
LELATQIQKRLHKNNIFWNVLVQINSAKEDTKGGVFPENAVQTYQQIKEECPNLKLQGIMSIGAYSDDKKKIEKSFNTTYKIFEKLQKDGASICSMGMSSDFELAIKCGSNMVRIGSALF